MTVFVIITFYLFSFLIDEETVSVTVTVVEEGKEEEERQKNVDVDEEGGAENDRDYTPELETTKHRKSTSETRIYRRVESAISYS